MSYKLIFLLGGTLIVAGYLLLSLNEQQSSPQPQTSTSRKEELLLQLEDTNFKMEELPELEKDIFAKCMGGKEPTASNIKLCEETTQKNVFTLSQELTNLKNSLQQELKTLP